MEEQSSLRLHGSEEFGVGFGLGEFVEEELHGVDGIEILDDLAEDPDAVEGDGVEEEFFFSGSGACDIEAWEGSSFHEFSVEGEFAVSGAFKFLEDDFVHAGAGVDEGGGDDGEGAAVFDVSCGAEEAFGFVECGGVDAAGEDFSGGGNDGVVGAGESRDGVEEDDDVVFVFDETFGLFDDHFGDLYVA